MKKIIQIFLIMFLNSSSEEIDYNEYQEIIDEINQLIDASLSNTQLAIHSVSKHTLSSFNKDVLYTGPAAGDSYDTFTRNVSSESIELFIRINTLLECRQWRMVQRQYIPVDIPLDRWMKSLKMNLVVLETEVLVINNSIDRLVMNGARNFTEKCEFTNSEDEIFNCLQSAVEEVYDVCDDLLDKLSRTLSNFRTIMCLNLDFIDLIDK